MALKFSTLGRKLVLIGLLGALAYVAIVLIIGLSFDWVIANTIGSGLVAVLTVLIFKLDEKHFRDREATVSGINRHSYGGFWYFVILSTSFVGIQLLVSFAIGALLIAVLQPTSGAFEIPRLAEELSIDNFWFIALVFLANCGAYCLGGFLCGKTATRIRYGYAALAAITALAINVLPFLSFILHLLSRKEYGLLFSMFWLVYVLLALAGARMGSGHPISEAIMTPRAED